MPQTEMDSSSVMHRVLLDAGPQMCRKVSESSPERFLAGDLGHRPLSVPATLSDGLMISHVPGLWFMWSWRAGVPSGMPLPLLHHCMGSAASKKPLEE